MYLTLAWMLFSSLSMLWIPTFGSAAVVGLICMTPIAPAGLRFFWSSCDSLVALGDRQHPVGAVAFAVRAKVLRHRPVLLDFPRARRIFEPLHAAEIALQQHVTEQRALRGA